MTTHPVIKEFHLVFGGSYSIERRVRNGKRMATCTLSGWNAYATLKAMFPYMKVKREHARLGIEFQAGRVDLRGSGLGLHPEILKDRQRYMKAFSKLNA